MIIHSVTKAVNLDNIIELEDRSYDGVYAKGLKANYVFMGLTLVDILNAIEKGKKTLQCSFIEDPINI